MSLTKISDNVYNVGVINPFIRSSHINKKCEYGTASNSYFIDDRKTAVVDIVDGDLFDDFLYNLGLVSDIGAIDYLVLNRVLSQQAESIRKMLEVTPNTVIVCTQEGKKILDNMLNRGYNCIVAGNGDKLKLGNNILEFITTPMLPSPDSMATYYENNGVIFSGAMFSADFCQPSVTDEEMVYIDEYMTELKNYFDYYLQPFEAYVKKVLETFAGKVIYCIAPQYGVVITNRVAEITEKYKQWCLPCGENGAVVLYLSTSGYTKEMALAVEKAFYNKGVKVTTADVKNITPQECAMLVKSAEYIAIGSSTFNKGLPNVMIKAISEIGCLNNENKKFFAFGSYGWSGESADVIAVFLQQCGMKQISKPFKVCMKPTEDDIKTIIEIIEKAF